MSLWKRLAGISNKSVESKLDAAYWKDRHQKMLSTKDIGVYYIAVFGFGNQGERCGVVKVEGFYDKTYPSGNLSLPYEERWQKTVDIFYQTNFDDSTTLYGYDVKTVFKYKNDAQLFYNENVDTYILPLQKRINDLNNGKWFVATEQ